MYRLNYMVWNNSGGLVRNRSLGVSGGLGSDRSKRLEDGSHLGAGSGGSGGITEVLGGTVSNDYAEPAGRITITGYSDVTSDRWFFGSSMVTRLMLWGA